MSLPLSTKDKMCRRWMKIDFQMPSSHSCIKSGTNAGNMSKFKGDNHLENAFYLVLRTLVSDDKEWLNTPILEPMILPRGGAQRAYLLPGPYLPELFFSPAGYRNIKPHHLSWQVLCVQPDPLPFPHLLPESMALGTLGMGSIWDFEYLPVKFWKSVSHLCPSQVMLQNLLLQVVGWVGK